MMSDMNTEALGVGGWGGGDISSRGYFLRNKSALNWFSFKQPKWKIN